jgi:hypothetical protein
MFTILCYSIHYHTYTQRTGEDDHKGLHRQALQVSYIRPLYSSCLLLPAFGQELFFSDCAPHHPACARIARSSVAALIIYI